MGVKGLEIDLGKRNLGRGIVNAIGDKYLRTPRRPNKGRKYNDNTLKDSNNRTKRLALLSRCYNSASVGELNERLNSKSMEIK